MPVRQYFLTATRTPHGFINPVWSVGEVLPDDGIDRSMRVLAEIYMKAMDEAGVKYLQKPAQRESDTNALGKQLGK